MNIFYVVQNNLSPISYRLKNNPTQYNRPATYFSEITKKCSANLSNLRNDSFCEWIFKYCERLMLTLLEEIVINIYINSAPSQNVRGYRTHTENNS